MLREPTRIQVFISNSVTSKKSSLLDPTKWAPFSDGSCGLYYKSFTIIIYNHNDRGQYYKTMIMIIIYDTSLS